MIQNDHPENNVSYHYLQSIRLTDENMTDEKFRFTYMRICCIPVCQILKSLKTSNHDKFIENRMRVYELAAY